MPSSHLNVTSAQWRQIFPNAPAAVITAFATKPESLIKAGVLATRNRLSFFCANIEHECGGFTIHNLTENIMYTAKRMAQVWPNRFSSTQSVINKYGNAPGWQLKAFDDIYGNRMGNRPGTHDGSTYIGRGGPQWTGRDGYAALERLSGVKAIDNPSLVSDYVMQPEVCAAFWTWKNLNKYADNNDFLGCVKIWNGGTNGLADRKHLMAGNNPIISRLQLVATTVDIVNEIESPSIVPAQHPIGDVRWVQESLNKIMNLEPPLETVSGIYGAKTSAAVEAFQRKYGVLPYDGIAGKKTKAAIENVLKEKM